MGALRENIKQSNETIKDWIEKFANGYSELMSIIFGQDDINSDNLEEAIYESIKKNPEDIKELEKIGQAIQFQEEKSMKAAEERFGEQDDLDKDGYNKIPNKLKGIETKVSEEKAVKNNKVRAKGGRQKTRVDED